MPSDVTRRLLALKRSLEEAQESQARLRGELDGVLRQLREEHGAEDLAAAEKLLAAQEAKATKLEAALRAQVEEIEVRYAGRCA